jgi:hypothetical protein
MYSYPVFPHLKLLGFPRLFLPGTARCGARCAPLLNCRVARETTRRVPGILISHIGLIGLALESIKSPAEPPAVCFWKDPDLLLPFGRGFSFAFSTPAACT